MDDETECTCSEPAATPPWAEGDPCDESLVELEPLREGPGHRVYELLPPTRFSWGNLLGSSRLTYVVGALAPVAQTPEALLVVRVHENAIGLGGLATAVVELITPSSEDPGISFAWSLTLAEVRVDATSGAAKAFFQRLRCDMGTHLRMRLHLDQGPSQVANSVTISVELVAREAVEDHAGGGRRSCDRV